MKLYLIDQPKGSFNLDDGKKHYGIYLHLKDPSDVIKILENYHVENIIMFRSSDGQLKEQFICNNSFPKFETFGYGQSFKYEDLFDESKKLIGNDDTLEIVAYVRLAFNNTFSNLIFYDALLAHILSKRYKRRQ